MIKTLMAISLSILGIETHAQINKIDTLDYVLYLDKSGNQQKAVVAKPKQILIVSGDSTYFLSTDVELRKLLEKQKSFIVINHPDSIRSFVRKRIKAVIVLEKKSN